MGLVEQLSSARGGRGQEANERVARKCLARPELMGEIVEGLAAKDFRLAGDCAEVMTKIAEARPELVASHARTLFALLAHKNGRVRWESAHAFALVAGQVPDVVEEQLAPLARIIREDESVIVRDYVIDAVARFGATGPAAARSAFPILREALDAFEGRHAARVLASLGGVVAAMPSLGKDARSLAQRFEDHARAGVRKAAKALLKATTT
jgi:hypothetical protein